MPLVKKAPLATPPGEVDMAYLIASLRIGTPDEKFSAARALAQVAGAVPSLDAALSVAADSRLREAIFTSLARQNSAAAYDVIARRLHSDDAELRSLALDAMRLMPEQTRSRLAALLRDADPDIRVLATELARQVPAEAAPMLATLLREETEVNVCAAAIEMLAEIGGLAHLPGLAACAARFPKEIFLQFSVKTASDRIRARAGA